MLGTVARKIAIRGTARDAGMHLHVFTIGKAVRACLSEGLVMCSPRAFLTTVLYG